MFPVKDNVRARMARPFKIQVRASLLRAGTQILGELPVMGGTVTVDGNAWVRRKATLTLPPRIKTGPYKSEWTRDFIRTKTDDIRLQWGVVFEDGGIEWMPLGIFRVDAFPNDYRGIDTVSISCLDYAADVADDAFIQPMPTAAGYATALIESLIKSTDSGFGVNTSLQRSQDARVPAGQADGERSDLIQRLATGIGAVVYVNSEGQFVIGDGPRLGTEPVYTLRIGPEGNLTDVKGTKTRAGVYNCVVVRGEAPSGDFAPVQATVKDETPSSPTQYGARSQGFFGKVTKTVSMPNVTTFPQAKQAAELMLAQYAGLESPLDLSLIPAPFLEPGDTIMVIPDDAVAAANARIVIVDSWTMDISAGGSFTLVGRDVREVIASGNA